MFTRLTVPCLLAIASFAIGLGLAHAQEQPLALGGEERVKELETALEASLQQSKELDRKVTTLGSANAVLGESLTESNKKLKELEEDYKSAVLHLELLGIDSFNTEGKGMQERLKKAVSDLRLVVEEKAKIAQAAMNLSTSTLAFVKEAENADPEARKEVEKSLRECDQALGIIYSDNVVIEKTLDDAKVISFKGELNLVVLDAGKRQGLITGTPIKIQRKDRLIASGLVVDVRDHIAGAVLREINDPNDTVKLGDQIHIAATSK